MIEANESALRIPEDISYETLCEMNVFEWYRYLIYDASVLPARNDLFLGTPWITLGILGAYLYFVKVFGPKFMEHRKPYNIDRIVLAYNIIQICWNTYIVAIYASGHGWGLINVEKYKFLCLPYMDNSKDYVGIQIYNASYFYYLNKQFDLLETVFFILRKKFNQVTYLHLFHHISVSSGSWYGTKYYPGGNPVVSGLLNSAVHILMHAYYTMSLLKIKKFMRLKKYITQIQLLQFLALLFYVGGVFFISNCQYEIVPTILVLFESGYMLYLFSKFYITTYINPQKKSL